MMIKRLAAALGAAMVVLAAVTPPAFAEEPASPVPDVPGCESGCTVVFDLHLPDDVRFIGLNGDPLGSGASRLVYVVGDEIRDVEPTPERGFLHAAACGYEGDAQRCAVSYEIGAHSAMVVSALFTYDKGVQITDEVIGDSAVSTLTDLDADGRPDATVRMSTYDPAYAGAPQYWMTYVENEGKFARTGCGSLETEPGPAPTAALTGACPAP